MLETITPEYRELNRQLHAKGSFGHGGRRWVKTVEALREQYKCDTVLDYGCGQGTLKKALGNPDWFHEYDPAIEGKEADPPRADLLICTDVLEHIEPELIDNVLEHIRDKTKKIAMLSIATRPAVKHLADGRNAHLLVREPVWWEQKLAPVFKILDFNIKGDELHLVLERQILLGELKTKSAVPDDFRFNNMKVNVPLVRGRLVPLPARYDLTAILCCYGPSLKKTWALARAKREAGHARIATVSGAHDFLITRGVVPDYHLECDPREHKCRFTENPHESVKYLLASCVHPRMIEQLKNNDVYLWHAVAAENSLEEINEVEPGGFGIAGGGSIGLRAMNALFVMGFRRFDVHGMDCSFEDGTEEQHAGDHSGKPHSVSSIRHRDRWFRSSLAMVSYARYFFKNRKILDEQAKREGGQVLNENGDHVEVNLYGDGLLQAMAIEANENPESAPAEAAE